MPNRLPTVISEEGGGNSRQCEDELPHCATEAQEINKPGRVIALQTSKKLQTFTYFSFSHAHNTHLYLICIKLIYISYWLIRDQIVEILINTQRRDRCRLPECDVKILVARTSCPDLNRILRKRNNLCKLQITEAQECLQAPFISLQVCSFHMALKHREVNLGWTRGQSSSIKSVTQRSQVWSHSLHF